MTEPQGFHYERSGNGSRHDTERLVIDADEFFRTLQANLTAEGLVTPPIAPSHRPKPEEIAQRLATLEMFLEISTTRLDVLEAENKGLKKRVELIERGMGVDYERHSY